MKETVEMTTEEEIRSNDECMRYIAHALGRMATAQEKAVKVNEEVLEIMKKAYRNVN